MKRGPSATGTNKNINDGDHPFQKFQSCLQGDKELAIESSEARSLQAPKLLRSLENRGSKINPASSFSAVNAGQEGSHQAGKCCYGLKAMPSNPQPESSCRKHMLQPTVEFKEIPAYAPNFW